MTKNFVETSPWTNKDDIQYTWQCLGTVVPLISWDLLTPCHMMPTGYMTMPHKGKVAMPSCATFP